MSLFDQNQMFPFKFKGHHGNIVNSIDLKPRQNKPNQLLF